MDAKFCEPALMQLDLLPVRHGSAAENMATDFLLLQRYPDSGYARFRHYGWHRPAFTFGYSQPISFARAQVPSGETVELCRRPTGGGVVDHRTDWTYALVIPPPHELYEARASESYRVVHACIAAALQNLGQPAVLEEPQQVGSAVPGVCFTRAEPHDVVNPKTREKIAGAAQKRSKHGLLFQGSLARLAVSPALDWDAFATDFTQRLADALALTPVESPWPELAEHELTGLIEQYSSPEWNEFR